MSLPNPSKKHLKFVENFRLIRCWIFVKFVGWDGCWLFSYKNLKPLLLERCDGIL